MEEINVTISPKGDTKVSVSGVKGEWCKAQTSALERKLGGVVSDVATPEMMEMPISAQAMAQN